VSGHFIVDHCHACAFPVNVLAKDDQNEWQVAEIFNAVLPAYAGAFQTVEFAILDHECLPDGNFQVFRTQLLGTSSSISLQLRHTSFRKIVVSEKVCPKLGHCHDRSDGHKDYWHPDMCPIADCAQGGDHASLLRHLQSCPDPNCKIVFGPKETRTGLQGRPDHGCFNASVDLRGGGDRQMLDC